MKIHFFASQNFTKRAVVFCAEATRTPSSSGDTVEIPAPTNVIGTSGYILLSSRTRADYAQDGTMVSITALHLRNSAGYIENSDRNLYR